MEKLEKLIQNDFGEISRSGGKIVYPEFLMPTGKIKTIVEANPCIDIYRVIDEMAERNSLFIPYGANSYVASDFNPDTQHIRKSNLEGDERFYSSLREFQAISL